MRRRFFLGFCCATAVISSVIAKQFDTTSRLSVSAPAIDPPPPIARELEHTDALFGIPLYSGSLSGPLIDLGALPGEDQNSDGCDPWSLPDGAPDDIVVLIDRVSPQQSDKSAYLASIPQKLAAAEAVVPSKSRPRDIASYGPEMLSQSYPSLALQQVLPRCTFAQRVQIAQDAGAAAVVIVFDAGVCGQSASCPSSGQFCSTQCEDGLGGPSEDFGCYCSLPFMVPLGGQGESVDIPSMLIDDSDAKAIRSCLQGDFESKCYNVQPASPSQTPSYPEDAISSPSSSVSSSWVPPYIPLEVTMAWDLPLPSGEVPIEIWTEPNDAPASDFLQALLPYFGSGFMSEFTALEPRFFVWDGAGLNCTQPIPGGPGGGLQCGSQCVNWGLYCAVDPDNDLERGLSGADVLGEVVRSDCVFHAANSSSFQRRKRQGGSAATAAGHASAKWMQYSTKFAERCLERGYISPECSTTVQREVDVSVDDVSACVARSNRTDRTNTLLERQLLERESLLLVVLPSVVIGDTVLRGRLDVPGLAAAACRAAPASTRATNVLCQCTASGSGDPLGCAERGGPGNSGGGGGGTGLGSPAVPAWVIGVIAGLVVVVGVLWIGGYVLFSRQGAQMGRLERLLEEDEQAEASRGRLEELGGIAVVAPGAGGGDADADGNESGDGDGRYAAPTAAGRGGAGGQGMGAGVAGFSNEPSV